MRPLLVLRIVAVVALLSGVVTCPTILYWAFTDPVFDGAMKKFIYQNFWTFNVVIMVWWQLAMLNLFIH